MNHIFSSWFMTRLRWRDVTVAMKLKRTLNSCQLDIDTPARDSRFWRSRIYIHVAAFLMLSRLLMSLQMIMMRKCICKGKTYYFTRNFLFDIGQQFIPYFPEKGTCVVCVGNVESHKITFSWEQLQVRAKIFQFHSREIEYKYK